MTPYLPLLIMAIIIAMLLAVFLWPAFRLRGVRKPIPNKEPVDFSEEYSSELTFPVNPVRKVEPVPELPASYGMDRLVLMVRDPYWLYAYWEITATKMEEFTSMYGTQTWGGSKTVLRVYDVTGINFDGNNANNFFDCGLNEFSDSWHVNVAEANRAYCVDLGKLLPNGSFITILRSNVVTTPRDCLSDRLDEEWMWIEGLYYLRHQTGVSSPMIIEEISGRMGNLPVNVTSPGFFNPQN